MNAPLELAFLFDSTFCPLLADPPFPWSLLRYNGEFPCRFQLTIYH